MTIDGKKFEALLLASVPDARAVRVNRIVPLAGGWSADTVRVQAACSTSSGQRALDVVVRRAPADGLLAPYDIERECRILRALRGSPMSASSQSRTAASRVPAKR